MNLCHPERSGAKRNAVEGPPENGMSVASNSKDPSASLRSARDDRKSALLFITFITLAPKPLLACTVCMGASDSPIAPAMNAAIFTMLGLIGSVLAGVASFAFYLNKKSKAPMPPHEELARGIPGLP